MLGDFHHLQPTPEGQRCLQVYAKACSDHGLRPNTGFAALLSKEYGGPPRRDLDLRPFFVTGKSLAAVLRASAVLFPDIAHMCFADSYLESDEVKAFLPLLSAFPRLESVDLSNNPIGEAAAAALAALVRNAPLCNLDVEGTLLADADLETLRKLVADNKGRSAAQTRVPEGSGHRSQCKELEGKTGLALLAAASGGVIHVA
ncbi:hypothetical protein DIPPA_09469 [Diplonema papillatum]|nr:hypothetical protein DIPPA_09469 [Diplonema papillatum]|eukprot:gene17652-27162_t